MPPGSYTVKVELQGFRTLEQKKNVVNASSHVDVGMVKLEVGTLSEVVSVVAEGATIETKNSDYSGLLTATQISQIQSRGRDVVNLLRLLPGVHYEADIEAMGDSFGSQIPNIGGMRKHWNQVTVDGLNGNELSGTNRMNSSINLDAIAEVKVLLNTYKAEFGHSGGANIEIVSKSGSSNYTGSAYWYGKRDKWNATPWENNRANLAKPKLHVDTPGFNLGGPVKFPGWDQGAEKKLFFFYSFEGPQVERPGPVRLYRMPTALERQGDFSQTFDANGRLINIKDPQSTAACNVTNGGAGCFPGNRIPTNRLDPNALALLNLMPLPNTTSANNAYNFTRQETSSNPRFNHLIRLDSRPSGSNTYWGSVRTWRSSQYRIRDHRGAGEVGVLRRLVRVGRQLGQRRLESHLRIDRRERVLGRLPPRHRRIRHEGGRGSHQHPQDDRRLQPAAVHDPEHDRRDSDGAVRPGRDRHRQS